MTLSTILGVGLATWLVALLLIWTLCRAAARADASMHTSVGPQHTSSASRSVRQRSAA